MREGVGIASSLRWVSQRFAQRALTGFFAGQWREFLIDAGIAVEHAAKAVVAANDPTNLIVDRKRDQLTDVDHAVLSGRSSAPHTSATDWDAAINHVASMPTILGTQAVRIAHDSFGVALDLAATIELLSSRNAAAHLGDVEIKQLDRHAAVLLASVVSDQRNLSLGIIENRHGSVFWSAVGDVSGRLRREGWWWRFRGRCARVDARTGL